MLKTTKDQAIPVYKPLGKTPLEMVNLYRQTNNLDPSIPISYAGRLDPMAEGILLLLVGQANSNREKYLKLNKTYQAQILFGVSTDTFDPLGLTHNFHTTEINLDQNQLTTALEKYLGKISQTYPPYSSKTVQSKPLWLWAKEGKLDQITLPKNQVEIYRLKVEKLGSIGPDRVYKEVQPKINSVTGDFRQQETLDSWAHWYKKTPHPLPLLNLIIDCSSGTYIRRLAEDLGQDFGTGALLYHLTRTHLGHFTLKDSLGL